MFQTLEQGGRKGLAGFGDWAVQLWPSINTFCEPYSWMSLQVTCLFWHHTEGTWLWCLKLRSSLGSDNFSSLSNPSGVVLVILNFEEMIWPENPNFIEMWQEPTPYMGPDQAFRDAPSCLKRNKSQATANGWEACSIGRWQQLISRPSGSGNPERKTPPIWWWFKTDD